MDTLGVAREMIYVAYVDPTAPDALSGLATLDSAGVDTLYMMTPASTQEAQTRGTRRNSISLRAKTVRELRARWRNSQSNKVGIDVLTGAKRAHTRWDYWSSLFDVKSLPEVNQIKVYLYTSGPGRIGPNWQAAARAAIANWNAQAKGTAISFVETNSATDHDVSIRGSYGIGPDGTNTSTAVLTPDELVEPDGISLWVNTGYENPSVPHNQKTTIVMALFAEATNIGFVGMEGLYWNMGSLINIPGTPATDGDPWTPGSSILTYGTTSYSTPNLTAGDLKAFSTLYPTHGLTVKLTNNNLSMVGYEGYTTVATDVNQFFTEGDTLVYSKNNGYIYRKVGWNGSSVQIWPGTGSSGTVAIFRYSRGYYAATSSNGSIYTKTPTGTWTNQSIGGMNFRLDGERFTSKWTDWNGLRLRTKYLSSSPGTWTTEWETSYSALSDFSIRNGLLVVVDAGNVWAKQGAGGTMTQIYSPEVGGGPATSVRLGDRIFSIFILPEGSAQGKGAVRVGGIGGGWWFAPDLIASPDDIDVCDDKYAYLEYPYARARVIDFTTWTVYEHFTLPNTFNMTKIQLRGGNCEYVTVTDNAQRIWSKYGEDLNTNYMPFQTGVGAFPQKYL